jgi:dCMP deaminase
MPSLEQFLQDDDRALFGTGGEENDASLNGGYQAPLLPSKSASLATADSHVLLVPPPGEPSPSPSPPLPPNGNSNGITKRAPSPLAPLIRRAHLVLSNHYSSHSSLYTKLDVVDIPGPKIGELLRPGWDEYFMCLAGLASLRSNCMKRRVGAVLVSPSYRVISTGYNGTPRGTTNCNQGERTAKIKRNYGKLKSSPLCFF